MGKNLVVYHMEYMPQSYFWQYRVHLPDFWEVFRESLSFQNCYTSGTSTEFAFNSLVYGSIAGVDACTEYTGIYSKPPIPDKGLFEVLRDEAGYMTIGFFSSFGSTERETPIPPIFATEYNYGYQSTSSTPCRLEATVERLAERLGQAVRAKRRFALFVHPLIDLAHRGIDSFPTLDSNGPVELQRHIFQQNNNVFKKIVETLKSLNILSDTMMVVYGDHGFDSYNNGFGLKTHRGMTTSAERSWVPLFFYNSSLGIGHTDVLASLDDLRATILGLLLPGKRIPSPNLPFSGIDLSRERRQFAYTQNKYAMQRVKDSQHGKTYSITDGYYHLHVEEWRPEKATGGMSMFMDQCDAGNNFDLLNLFSYDDLGKITGIYRPSYGKIAGSLVHFTLNPEALLVIMERYEFLREKLHEFVRSKEKHALQHLNSGTNCIAEKSFFLPKVVIERQAQCPGREENFPGKGLKWLKAVAQRRPVLIFGAAWFGARIPALLRNYQITVAGFVDNYEEKQNTEYEGRPVYSPEDAARSFPDALVIGGVFSNKNNNIISKQCLELGLEYYNFLLDIIGYAELF